MSVEICVSSVFETHLTLPTPQDATVADLKRWFLTKYKLKLKPSDVIVTVESNFSNFGVRSDTTKLNSSDLYEAYTPRINSRDLASRQLEGLHYFITIKRGVRACTDTKCRNSLCTEHEETDARVGACFIHDVSNNLVLRYLSQKHMFPFTEVLDRFGILVEPLVKALHEGSKDAAKLEQCIQIIKTMRTEKVTSSGAKYTSNYGGGSAMVQEFKGYTASEIHEQAIITEAVDYYRRLTKPVKWHGARVRS